MLPVNAVAVEPAHDGVEIFAVVPALSVVMVP
jgi:hypothetical protein